MVPWYSARSPTAKMAGHSFAADRQRGRRARRRAPRAAREFGQRRDAGGDEEASAGNTPAVVSAPATTVSIAAAAPRAAPRCRGLAGGRAGARQALVELAPQQPRAALEYGRAQAELAQRVRRLEAEQARRRQQRPPGAGLLDVNSRIPSASAAVRSTKCPGPPKPRSPARRPPAHGEDQPVVGKPLAGAEQHLVGVAVDPCARVLSHAVMRCPRTRRRAAGAGRPSPSARR